MTAADTLHDQRLELTDVLGNATELTAALGEVRADVATAVAVVRFDDTGGDLAQAWIVEAITALIGWLGETVGPSRPGLAEDERPSIAIVATFSEAALARHPEYCEAAAEALRGTLQSLIAERGSELRGNLAIGSEADHEDLCDLVGYIASDGGRFMSGARVDLRKRGS
jgi:hypothetical protein